MLRRRPAQLFPFIPVSPARWGARRQETPASSIRAAELRDRWPPCPEAPARGQSPSRETGRCVAAFAGPRGRPGRDAAGPSGRGRAVPRLAGPAPSGFGGALGRWECGQRAGDSTGPRRRRCGSRRGSDRREVCPRGLSHRPLPPSTAHLASVARPLLVSIFTPFVLFLPTWHLIFLLSSLLCSPPTPSLHLISQAFVFLPHLSTPSSPALAPSFSFTSGPGYNSQRPLPPLP